MFQAITAQDLVTVGFLTFLEGILSLDNALVLALIVTHLPKELQKKALIYGVWGAIIFRTIAVFFATYLMYWNWIKFVGGGYLLFLAIQYWISGKESEKKKKEFTKHSGFWKTVIIVELADIAFAIDSILTAVALSNKIWIVLTGGIIGLLLMRFAASYFIQLLEKFPRFEDTAYILIFIIGFKLILEGFHFSFLDFHSSSTPEFWGFWILMLLGFLFGFTRKNAPK